MLASAHERQLHVVLNVFDVYSATVRHAPGQRRDHLFGELCDQFVDACRSRCIAPFDREEGFGQGDADLAAVKGCDFAVATNYPVTTGRCSRHFSVNFTLRWRDRRRFRGCL